MLRVAADRDAIIQTVDQELAAVPHAIGVNNHMGSRFTNDREDTALVLERVNRLGCSS